MLPVHLGERQHPHLGHLDHRYRPAARIDYHLAAAGRRRLFSVELKLEVQVARRGLRPGQDRRDQPVP
jgi:hypothetical protein